MRKESLGIIGVMPSKIILLIWHNMASQFNLIVNLKLLNFQKLAPKNNPGHA